MKKQVNINNKINNNVLSTLALALGIMSISLMIYSVYMPCKAWISQQLIAYNWQYNKVNKLTTPPWPWADTTAIAKLTVPRLEKSLVLLKGTDTTTLAFSAGVMHQYSALTSHSPFVVAGHRDTHFEFLQRLQLNDVISLTDLNGKIQQYEIKEMNVINSDVSPLLIDENDNSLVLVTCYPFNALRAGGSLRYVVKAKMIKNNTLV